MNDNRIKLARMIRLGLFIAVWFSILWIFRWEMSEPINYEVEANTVGPRPGETMVFRLDRWTGEIDYTWSGRESIVNN